MRLAGLFGMILAAVITVFSLMTIVFTRILLFPTDFPAWAEPTLAINKTIDIPWPGGSLRVTDPAKAIPGAEPSPPRALPLLQIQGGMLPFQFGIQPSFPAPQAGMISFSGASGSTFFLGVAARAEPMARELLTREDKELTFAVSCFFYAAMLVAASLVWRISLRQRQAGLTLPTALRGGLALAAVLLTACLAARMLAQVAYHANPGGGGFRFDIAPLEASLMALMMLLGYWLRSRREAGSLRLPELKQASPRGHFLSR